MKEITLMLTGYVLKIQKHKGSSYNENPFQMREKPERTDIIAQIDKLVDERVIEEMEEQMKNSDLFFGVKYFLYEKYQENKEQEHFYLKLIEEETFDLKQTIDLLPNIRLKKLFNINDK
jgi:hypothetical protein